MPQRILGIDLGSYSVKAAEIERGFKSFSLVGFYERPVQYSELLTPEESLAIALQGLIDDHNLHWDSCIVGMPGGNIASRVVTFPFGGSKRIAQAIPFELETYIPFDIEDVVWDYSIIRQSKDFSKVLIVYCLKKNVANLLNMLSGINVDPRRVCAEGVELSHLMNLGLVPPEGGYAIVDIGHRKMTVTVCHGTEFGHSRSLLIGGDNITRAIADKLGVSYEEAERLKIELGQVSLGTEVDMDETSLQIMDATKKVLDEMVLHLRQTLFAYRETEEVPPQGIYLSGGTSRMPGIDRYISDALKINVTYLDCTEMQFSHLERASANKHVVPVALSYALRGVAGGGISVNFRKGEFAFKGDVEEVGGGVRRLGLTAAVLISLSLVSFTWRYYSLKSKFDSVSANAAAMVTQIIPDAPKKVLGNPKDMLAFIKSREAEILSRAEKLEAVISISPLDILREFSAAVPPKDQVTLDVQTINVSPPRIILSGTTDSFEAVDKIKQAVESSHLFEKVTTGNVQKGVKGGVKFDLSFEVEGFSGGV